jgi:hypothetical protein
VLFGGSVLTTPNVSACATTIQEAGGGQTEETNCGHLQKFGGWIAFFPLASYAPLCYKIPFSSITFTQFSVRTFTELEGLGKTLAKKHPPLVPPHELLLKEGVPVILLRNMNRSLGLMNGTRGVIQKCLQYSVLISVPQADGTIASIPIPRINLNPPDTGAVKINFTRRQLPLRVAYAMTINKSQGQTLKRVGVWLPKDVFSHGQLYVALSRVRSNHPVSWL